MNIPKIWTNLALGMAQKYAEEGLVKEWHGPNWTIEVWARHASHMLWINMRPNAYKRYGKRLEKLIEKTVIETYNELIENDTTDF